MQQSTHANHTKLFFGGLLIGGIAAALLTPRSGKENRDIMKDKVQRLKESTNSIKDDIADKAKNDSQKVADAIRHESDQLKEVDTPRDFTKLK